MIEFTPRHRQVFSEKVLDIGNIAAGALIFGQFVFRKTFKLDFGYTWNKYTVCLLLNKLFTFKGRIKWLL